MKNQSNKQKNHPRNPSLDFSFSWGETEAELLAPLGSQVGYLPAHSPLIPDPGSPSRSWLVCTLGQPHPRHLHFPRVFPTGRPGVWNSNVLANSNREVSHLQMLGGGSNRVAEAWVWSLILSGSTWPRCGEEEGPSWKMSPGSLWGFKEMGSVPRRRSQHWLNGRCERRAASGAPGPLRATRFVQCTPEQ